MANEKRLIDANELMKHIKDLPTWFGDGGGCWLCLEGYPKGMFDPEDIVSSIDDAPAVDAVEVVHGRWNRKQIGKYTGADEVVCSCCGYFIAVVCSDTGFNEAIKGMNYCPNCGAKMDGDGNGT